MTAIEMIEVKVFAIQIYTENIASRTCSVYSGKECHNLYDYLGISYSLRD